MIVAESIGFAATHSISEILSGVPGFDVSHGSQHFEEKVAVGLGQQTCEEFVASMKQSEDAGQRPVAVHTLFPPQTMKPACEAVGVDYWLLVRNPTAQIDSCYAWIARSVLGGHPGHFLQVLRVSASELVRLNIPASLPNALYYFAVHHVLSFNFLAIGLGAPVKKMEDLMTDESAFRAAFNLPADVALPHFAGDTVHRASHRARTEAGALAEPDRDTILAAYRLNLGGRDYALSDMQMLLGY